MTFFSSVVDRLLVCATDPDGYLRYHRKYTKCYAERFPFMFTKSMISAKFLACFKVETENNKARQVLDDAVKT